MQLYVPPFSFHRRVFTIFVTIDCTRESNCSTHGTCVNNGTCQCDVGFTGANCSRCVASYYGYPECNCMPTLLFTYAPSYNFLFHRLHEGE